MTPLAPWAGVRAAFYSDVTDLLLLHIDESKLTSPVVVEQVANLLAAHVAVLDPNEHEILTLVTCYPFYFVALSPPPVSLRGLT